MELTKEEKMKAAADQLLESDTVFMIARKAGNDQDEGRTTALVAGSRQSLAIALASYLCDPGNEDELCLLETVTRMVRGKQLQDGGQKASTLPDERVDVMVKRLRMADFVLMVCGHEVEDKEDTIAGGLMVLGSKEKLMETLLDAMKKDTEVANMLIEVCVKYMASKVKGK